MKGKYYFFLGEIECIIRITIYQFFLHKMPIFFNNSYAFSLTKDEKNKEEKNIIKNSLILIPKNLHYA